MQINDLRIQKFNKISHLSNLSNPQILQSFYLVKKFNYDRSVHSFHATDRNGSQYQIYITRLKPHDLINQTVYLKDCPKIIYLNGDSQSLIIQQKIQERLNQYIIKHQQRSMQNFPQKYARQIMKNITQSLVNYCQCKIPYYDCISTKNIVMDASNKWQLSVVGFILGIDRHNSQLYHNVITNQQNNLTFALGSLFFRLLFGFSPLTSDQKHFKGFQSKNYLKTLQNQSSQKLLKVYHYSQKVIQISPLCLKLLQECLTGKMSLDSWINHQYFKGQFNYQVTNIHNKNRQIFMINSVQPNYYSLVMSAIDYKKNHHLQKLNHQSIPSPQQMSNNQVLQFLQKHHIFSNISISSNMDKKSQTVRGQNQSILNGFSNLQYFYNGPFDIQNDYPCRQLIKLIQNQKNEHPQKFNNIAYENSLKLYGYPYALAFELLKVESLQPIQIKRKIKKSVQILLQLSALYYPRTIQPLHNTQPHIKSFQQIKPIYRQNINELYQYFLNQAMKKYNFKSQNMEILQKVKRKQKGLEYYRLCLKLLEGSLLVRKGGADLDLTRIQTAQRKQIQNDITQLLNKYFPKKPQIN